ncbi:hypothetical protein BT69DRAFT_1283912 [Atractiella rhizophila]|nr:hypothetical protein BT69DRAFT_1283912 [Atractiella rhizophila]
MKVSILSFLPLIAALPQPQVAGPQPSLVYTYDGQSVDPSILSAAAAAGVPYNSLLSVPEGANTATATVGNFTTGPTRGSPTVPLATGAASFSSGPSGEIGSTNVRNPHPTTGTFTLPDLSKATGTAASENPVDSGAGGRNLNGGGRGMVWAGMAVVLGFILVL